MFRIILGIVSMLATVLLWPEAGGDYYMAIDPVTIGLIGGGLLGAFGGGGDRSSTSVDPATQAFIEQYLRPGGINISNQFLGRARGGLDVGFDPEDIQEFMNPFLSDVVGATEADFERIRGRALRDAKVSNTLAGTGRGSAGAIRLAETEGQLGLNEALALAGLRSDAFGQASGLALSRAGINMDRLRGAMGALQGGIGPTGSVTETRGPGGFGGRIQSILGGAASGGLLGAGIKSPGSAAASSFNPSFDPRLQADPNLFAGARLSPTFNSGSIRLGNRFFQGARLPSTFRR